MNAFKKQNEKSVQLYDVEKKAPVTKPELRVQNVLSMTVMKTFATIVSEINLSTSLHHMM